MVVANACNSSCVAGTGSRALTSRSEISAAVRRMRSTGRNAAPARTHPPIPAATTAMPPPISSAFRTRLTAASVGSSEVPTRMTRPDRSGFVSTRYGSRSPPTFASANCSLRRARRITEASTTGRFPASVVARRTRPLRSNSCATSSRSSTTCGCPVPCATWLRKTADRAAARVRSPGSRDERKPLLNDSENSAPPTATNTRVASANAKARRTRIGMATVPRGPGADTRRRVQSRCRRGRKDDRSSSASIRCTGRPHSRRRRMRSPTRGRGSASG